MKKNRNAYLSQNMKRIDTAMQSVQLRLVANNCMMSIIMVFIPLICYAQKDTSVSIGSFNILEDDDDSDSGIVDTVWIKEHKQDIVDNILRNMVKVDGGSFTPGEPFTNSENEIAMEIAPFHICKYEVTQLEWFAIMDENPSNHCGGNLPVEQVSLEKVQEFIKRLNQQTGKSFRLPTMYEWEYAARGGHLMPDNKKLSSWTPNDKDCWYGENSGGKSHPVGRKTPNELGLYDMAGNVGEWCTGSSLETLGCVMGGCFDSWWFWRTMESTRGNKYVGLRLAM